MLLEHGIRISMDGKGRYMDNIFVERLWRSVKYEEVYLKAYQNVPEARAGIGAYLRFYNHERPHQALGYQTPQEIFEEGQGWGCLHEQGLALPSNFETTSPVMVPTKPAEDSLNLALSLSKQWGPLHFSNLAPASASLPEPHHQFGIYLVHHNRATYQLPFGLGLLHRVSPPSHGSGRGTNPYNEVETNKRP